MTSTIFAIGYTGSRSEATNITSGSPNITVRTFCNDSDISDGNPETLTSTIFAVSHIKSSTNNTACRPSGTPIISIRTFCYDHTLANGNPETLTGTIFAIGYAVYISIKTTNIASGSPSISICTFYN